jgi:CRP-like cAMP-binding protein
MKESKKACDLQSCFFCRTCLKEWIPAIAVNRKTFQVKKGEVLFSEGEPVTGVFFVSDGKVKVHKKWGDEKELIIRIADKGAILGHRGLGTITSYPVSATAMEISTVCFIDLAFFEASVKLNHEFTYSLLMFFADELRESERKMRNLAHMPVKGRVSQALLTFTEKFGVTADGFIDILLSKQDLAAYTGATYETVFRILNELTEEGVIEMVNKQLRVIDPARLTAYAETR